MRSADNICLNCDFELKTELYCPNCGQKTHSHDLSLKHLFSSFYVTFIDFDKKIFRSLRDIWVPNKISTSFLGGGRKYYVNHLRFFVLCLALFFTLITLNMRQLDLSTDLSRTTFKNKMLSEIEAFEAEKPFSCDTVLLDSLKLRLFNIEKTENDSTYKAENDVINFEFDKKDIALEMNDIYNLSQDSLFSKYKVEGKFPEFFAGQMVKVIKNGGSLFTFAIGNMFWGIILMTIIMAVFLKVIYIRHKSFYAEHLMQMLNYHCVFTLIMSVLLFIDLFTKVSPNIYIMGTIISGIHLSYSLKRYYNQGLLKMILKSGLLLFAYLFAFCLILLIILGLSVISF